MAETRKRTYGEFKERHPEYKAELWKRYRAFYAGGEKLLGDAELMAKVFPKHHKEASDVYEERVKRAFYLPYAGEILDSLVAGLCYKPITMEGQPEGAKPDADGKVETVEDEFWADFYENVARPGARPLSLNQLLRHQVNTALQLRTAWTLVDLPTPEESLPSAEGPAEVPPVTVAAQEEAGYLRAYACAVEPECVVNWEEDEAGELVATLVREERIRWAGLGTSRDTVTEFYTYYTRDAWEKWSITYKIGKEPKDSDEMTFEGADTHSFGAVPLVRLTLTDGLHAMGKIESIAREHFNKRNAVSWSQLKNLLPILAAKIARTPLDPDGSEGTAQLLGQAYGPGRVLILGSEDDLSYVAPDAAVYESSLMDLSNLRDEMHRVLHAMAQSVDNSGAALQRSGDSKAMDQESTAVVLRALGHYVREHAEEVYRMAAAGRLDPPDVNWVAKGCDEFSDVSVTALVEQAMTLETVSIPSPTFQKAYKLELAKVILAKRWNDELEKLIKGELDNTVTEDQFVKPTPMEEFKAANQPPPGKAPPK